MLKVILILHFAVFLSGFTGVFGRLITYDAFVLVYIRFIIAGLAAYAFVKITHKLVKVSFKDKANVEQFDSSLELKDFSRNY